MMENPWIEPMLESELDEARKLTDVQVVFDVGARTSLEYLQIFPNATFHLFEPFPVFAIYLKESTKDIPNVFVHDFGLGFKEGVHSYDFLWQSFVKHEKSDGKIFQLRLDTLDNFVEKNNITRIDFLKIDAEECDYDILLGGKNALKMVRYLQYEHDSNKEKFEQLLKDDFELKYIGDRNVFCIRK